jgi:hypothetical protein
MGHVIHVKGVQVYQENIQKILDWPTPRSIIELWGFFGLCSYYKFFVKGFSQLGVPLTDLTKNSEFRWSKKAHDTFDRVNKVMSTFPMLALPYFSWRLCWSVIHR